MSLKSLFFVAMASVIAIAGFAGKPSRNQAQRKARYYYTEGLRAMAEGRGPEAYEYLAKAHAIDPENINAAYDYGSLRVHLTFDSITDSDERQRSMLMMKPYVKAYPGDATKAQFYAYKLVEDGNLDEALEVYKGIVDARPENADNLPRLADLYMRLGDMENALATLNRYEAVEGPSVPVSMHKAGYHVNNNDSIGAIAELDALIATNPREPEYYVAKGQLMDYFNMLDSAMNCYLLAEKLDPTHGGTQYAMAMLYEQKGDSVAYDTRIYNALMSESFDLDTKLRILSDYLQTFTRDKNSLHRGDVLFDALNEQYPHEAVMLDFTAKWKAFKQDFDGAAETVRYAIDLDPSNQDYRSSLMSYLVAGDKPQEAMKEYHASVEQNGDDPDLALLYAAAAQELDSIDIVKETYAKLIHDIVPEFPISEPITDKSPARNLDFYGIYMLSNYYQGYGDALYVHFQKHPENKELLDTVYTAYENSLSLISDNAIALNNYAYFLAENGGDLEKAKEMSSRAITNSETSTNLDTYAWILFRMGDYKEAKTYMEAAMEKAREEGVDNSAELLGHYGDILFMNGDPEGAVENWKKALEDEPDDALLKKKVEHRTFFYE